MITELTREQAPCLAGLFGYTEETLIASYIQGHFGRGWADNVPDPSCGRITVSGFTFFAGDCARPEARELVEGLTGWTQAVPQNEGWNRLVEDVYGGNAKKLTRYAIKKEPGCFDREKLEGFVRALPKGYALRRMDEELYHLSFQRPFSRHFCSSFLSARDFLERGLGFCVMRGGEIAAGASSFTIYDGGIEINIATAGEHRRKGLATVCAARLILACLDRGLYPSWDAANPESVGLAEKLGYHFSHEYDAYVIEIGE